MIWDNYKKSWVNAFDISGRATRAEWWIFTLLNNLFIFVAALAVGSGGDGFIVIVQLMMLIPAISVSVRRVRDIGISGWWSLLIVPLGLPMLIVAFIPSSIKENLNHNDREENQSPPNIKDFHYTPNPSQTNTRTPENSASSAPTPRLPLKDFN